VESDEDESRGWRKAKDGPKKASTKDARQIKTRKWWRVFWGIDVYSLFVFKLHLCSQAKKLNLLFPDSSAVTRDFASYQRWPHHQDIHLDLHDLIRLRSMRRKSPRMSLIMIYPL
jgi:hypothetical protein